MTNPVTVPLARDLDRGSTYTVPPPAAPCELELAGNEGRAPRDLVSSFRIDDAELVRRYPDATALERRLAERIGRAPEDVIVTAGADDALLRISLAFLDRGREIVLPRPTFEMIERYAHLAGATVRDVDWREGPYPVERVLDAVGERTALVAVVSPNNPTGATATADDLRLLSQRVAPAWLLVDLAYAEFADEDLTTAALELPNAIVVRTFSKAYGLAGLRVGWAAGPRRAIDGLRRAGNPYPVSGPSLRLALAALDEVDPSEVVERVRRERDELRARLEALGARALPSQANFVLARFRDAEGVRTELAQRGVAVRAFPGREGLEDALRITCPGHPGEFDFLLGGLEGALARVEAKR